MGANDYIIAIAAIAAAAIFGYLIYAFAIGLVAGEKDAQEILLKAIGKPANYSTYTLAYRTEADGYRTDVRIVHTPAFYMVETRDTFYTKTLYSNSSRDVLCIGFNGRELCSDPSLDADLNKSAAVSRALVPSARAARDAETLEKKINYGFVRFGEPEQGSANGKECTIVSYNVSYANATLGQLNDLGISASSPEVLYVKGQRFEYCIDAQSNLLSYDFTYVYRGVQHNESALYTENKWGDAGGASYPRLELSNPNATKDLFLEALSARQSVLACFSNSSTRDECVKQYAIKNGFPALCTLAGSKKDTCILSTAAQNPIPQLCLEIANLSTRDACWLEMAVATENASLCANMNDAQLKSECLNSLNTGARECSSDVDCFTAGCSAQLCVPESQKGTITTCEMRPEYECLKYTSCGCNEGKCGWAQTSNYTSCISQLNLTYGSVKTFNITAKN